MAENKKRDDTFVNKDEQYEINYITNQYPENDRDEIEQIIRKGKYQTHEEIYKTLQSQGYEKI
jgi:hypothetical protein